MSSMECKSCGAPIIWAMSANRKWIPFDAQPTRDGRWHVEFMAGGESLAWQPATNHSGQDRYTPHWATCPNANKHRRRTNA